MKKMLIILTLCLSSQAFSEEKNKEENMKQKLEEHKKMRLAHIDEKINHLQSMKSCVSAAQNKDDMKKCHEQAEAFRDQMKEKWKSFKKERKGDD